MVVAPALPLVVHESLHAASCVFVYLFALFSVLLPFKKSPFPSQGVVFSECHVFLYTKGDGNVLNFFSGS